LRGILSLLYQPCAFQNPKMLRDRGQGEIEGARKLAHGGFAVCQPHEHRPPRRVGERGER